MHRHKPDDEAIRARSAHLEVNVMDEAATILRDIWVNKRPQYSTHASCLGALEKDDKLYKALKDAHTKGKYDVIRNWRTSDRKGIPHICRSFWSAITQTLATAHPNPDATVSVIVQHFLKEIRGSIACAVGGEASLGIWSPEAGSPFREYLQDLQIPLLEDKPCLLLHNLGKEDPGLKKRLDNVFTADGHTFLVNVSGSGKTRTLFEGLCQNWGLYFTSPTSTSLLGSSDVQKTIRRIFLARLLIFSCFFENMGQVTQSRSSLNEYRKRWLLLQLHPEIVRPRNIFDHLSNLLSAASDSYVNTQIHELLKRAHEFCARDVPQNSPQPPFYCVFDEAQLVATSFCSDRNGEPQAMLREIIHAWAKSGVFLIVAGTGIPKDVVEQAMASGIMKNSSYRWCSDTGAFDTVEAQHRYLVKYLPKSLLRTESWKRLLRRIWYWLRGRHRFTADYVMVLMHNGFQQPHRLLNAYVEHVTDFSVTDASEFVKQERGWFLPILSGYKLDFSKLKDNSGMAASLHCFIVRRLMGFTTAGSLGGDRFKYVEYGLALNKSDTQSIVIDEPLVFLATTQWMTENHRTIYDFLTQDIGGNHLKEGFNGFENYLAYCLDLIFSKNRRLDEVFEFHGKVPPWANLEAQIVALHRPSTQRSRRVEVAATSFSNLKTPSVALGFNGDEIPTLMSWLKHADETRSPFCFPNRWMGPDILFVLRLLDGSSNGSLIWVALQAKNSENDQLPNGVVSRAIQSVTPSQYFLARNGQSFSSERHPNLRADMYKALSNLPHKRDDAGEYSLLRVLASFPALAREKRLIEEDPERIRRRPIAHRHPIASLNMALVDKVTRDLSPLNFLQSLRSPQKSQLPAQGLKRKRSSDTTGSRRKKNSKSK